MAELGREAISRPGDPRVQFELGRKLEAAGRREEALVAFATALRLKPDDRRLYEQTATILVEAGHLDQAEGLLAGALEQWPKDGKLRLAYADVLARLDLWHAAGEEQARALSDLPASDRTSRRYGALGSFHMEAKEYTEAVEAFQQAVRLSSSEPGVQRGLGAALLEAKRPHEALTSLEAALRVNPKDTEAAYFLGRTALSTGEQQRGEGLLKQVTEANPGHVRAELELGRLYISRKIWGAAETCFESALRSEPRSAKAYEGLAEVMNRQGKSVEASHATRRAAQIRSERHRIDQLEVRIATNPESAPVLRELVQRYKDDGRLRQASRRLVQLLTLHPKDPVGLKLRTEFEALKKSGLAFR